MLIRLFEDWNTKLCEFAIDELTLIFNAFNFVNSRLHAISLSFFSLRPFTSHFVLIFDTFSYLVTSDNSVEPGYRGEAPVES